MTATALGLAALLLLRASSAGAQPSGREQLREALSDYYAHVVAEKLELSDEQARALRPRLDGLVTAQQQAMSGSRAAQRRLDEASRTAELDAAAVSRLIGECLDTQAEARQRLARARRDLISGLEPRQQALFMLSEGEYRRAVMEHLRRLRSEQGPPGAETPPDSPWRRAREAEAENRPAPPELDERQRVEMRENMTLHAAFQLLNQGEVPLEHVVSLLPLLEAAVSAQLDLAHLERVARHGLRQALDAEAGDADLERRVESLLSEEATLAGALEEARRSIALALDPLAAALYLSQREGFPNAGPLGRRWMQRQVPGEGGAAPERGGEDAPPPRRRPR